MTVGLSAPDAALVHGLRGSEEDGGEADDPETDGQKRSRSKFHFHDVERNNSTLKELQ